MVQGSAETDAVILNDQIQVTACACGAQVRTSAGVRISGPIHIQASQNETTCPHCGRSLTTHEGVI